MICSEMKLEHMLVLINGSRKRRLLTTVKTCSLPFPLRTCLDFHEPGTEDIYSICNLSYENCAVSKHSKCLQHFF